VATIDLNWIEVAGGFESGSYRIEPFREHPKYNWQLLISAASDALRGPRALSMPTTHATLRGARAQALRLERERILQTRIVRHLVVGTAASVGFLVFHAHVSSFLSFCIALALVAAGVRSLATAAILALGDAWGLTDHTSVDAESRLDAVILAAVGRLRPRRVDQSEVEPKVRVLPPLPPD
jgi:hypothetical protein